MRIFKLDLVDHVDTKVQMHRLITEDVLELLCNARHFVATPHRQDLGEAAVEEDTLCHTIKADQVAQQLLASSCCAT